MDQVVEFEGSQSEFEAHLQNSVLDLLPLRKNLDSNVNEYGRELINTCLGNGLAIINGRTEGDKKGMYTRVHTTGKSVVDYILVPVEKNDILKSFSVEDGMPESDHRPLKFAFVSKHIKDEVIRVEHKRKEHRYFKWDENNKDNFLNNLKDDLGNALLTQFIEKTVNL